MSEILTMEKELNRYYPDRGDAETIFVVMASYRDNECVQTIMNIFESARYPGRVRMGVFQQHNFTDGDCSDFDKFLNCEPTSTGLYVFSLGYCTNF